MPNFDTYWQSAATIDATSRAVDAWNRILDKPTSITLQGAVADITVRIEHDGDPHEQPGTAGRAYSLSCTVFGVKGHPNVTVADTVIVPGDKFALTANGKTTVYVVERVIELPGEIQAFARSV